MEIIIACLAKKPGDCPQSVQVLLDRLRDLAIDHPWSHREAADWWEDYSRSARSAGTAKEGV